MILVIPSLRIDHSECCDDIASLGHHYHDPSARARLLRKENAKALHIIVDDVDVWCEESLCVIRSLREAVDIPTEVSLAHIPDDVSDLVHLIEAGVYRIFLSPETPLNLIAAYCQSVSPTKLVPTYNSTMPTGEDLDFLQALKLQRLAIIRDDNMHREIDWMFVDQIAAAAKERRLKITTMFYAYSFADLMRLQGYSPVIDSVVLGTALLKNLFPCQTLWREAEQTALAQEGEMSNLWKNPLEGIPHI